MSGTTYEEENRIFNRKKATILRENPEKVKDIQIIWHCQWRKKRFTERKLWNEFITAVQPDLRAKERLAPRHAVLNGINAVYRLIWKKQTNPNERLYMLDINSAYCFCAEKFPFPVGNYRELIGKEIFSHIRINQDGTVANKDGSECFGVIKARIRAKKTNKYPYILSKCGKNNQLIASLCHKCAKIENTKECRHSDRERDFIVTLVYQELNYAIKNDYNELIEIYECWHYEASSFIFKDYMECLSLIREKFEQDTIMKKQIKVFSVSQLGKLLTNINHHQDSKLCESFDELHAEVIKKKPMNITQINKDIIEVLTERKVHDSNRTDTRFNVILGKKIYSC